MERIGVNVMAVDNTRKLINNMYRSINEAFLGKGRKYILAKTRAMQWLLSQKKKFKGEESNPDLPEKSAYDYIMKWRGTFYLFNYKSKLYNEYTIPVTYIRDKKGKIIKKKVGKPIRKLPFYDEFPLIMVLELHKDGFLGLNFHYLPLRIRIMVIKVLVKTYGKKFVNNKILQPTSYKLIKKICAFDKRIMKHATKKYLWTQLLKIRGYQVIRMHNTELLQSMFYASPSWKSITDPHVKGLFNKL